MCMKETIFPEEKKRMHLGFTLLNKNKTLTDEEIDKTMEKLMKRI